MAFIGSGRHVQSGKDDLLMGWHQIKLNISGPLQKINSDDQRRIIGNPDGRL